MDMAGGSVHIPLHNHIKKEEDLEFWKSLSFQVQSDMGMIKNVAQE